MYLSEQISELINSLLNESDGTAEIQRNELAFKLGCVPSQINYVITSRFTPEKGYHVESRRGGGGYIRIRRVPIENISYVMHFINIIEGSVDYPTCVAFLNNLGDEGFLTDREREMLKLTLSDRALNEAPQELRNNIRASALKNAMLALFK